MNCGDAMKPDVEQIIDLKPEAILLSPFENGGDYGRLEEIGVPVIECADYMEESALGACRVDEVLRITLWSRA